MKLITKEQVLELLSYPRYFHNREVTGKDLIELGYSQTIDSFVFDQIVIVKDDENRELIIRASDGPKYYFAIPGFYSRILKKDVFVWDEIYPVKRVVRVEYDYIPL